MRKFLQIGKWQLDRKLLSILSILAFLVLMVPILRIMLYTIPWNDDYTYSLVSRRMWLQDHTLGGVLWGAWYTTRTNWYAWQGTFSSIFFMSLMPGLFGEKYYFIGPMLILAVLILGCFALVRVIVHDILGGDLWDCLVLQAGVTGIVAELVHSSRSAYFWYNSGVHYVMMHGFCLLFAAGLIKLLYAKNRLALVLLVLWSLPGAVLTAGSNYVTALQGMLFVTGILIWAILRRRKRSLLVLPSFLVCAYCFYRNISAPGNKVRAGALEAEGVQGQEAFSAVLNSFAEAFRNVRNYTSLLTILAILLLLPSIWNLVKKSKISFRYPLLVTMISVCFYATGFTPSLYTMGHGGLDRTMNAVKITYQILLLINIGYWMGWLAHREKKGKLIDRNAPAYWWYYALIGIGMSAWVLVSGEAAMECTSYISYYLVHTGEAYVFYQEYCDRIAAIYAGGTNVEVEPYSFRPSILFINELSLDPNAWQNHCMAQWYDKESLTLKLMEP